MELDKIKYAEWDAVIVGTGIGGATLGYALAKAGKRVLFCERGPSYLAAKNSVRVGEFAELGFPARVESSKVEAILNESGRYHELLQDDSGSDFYPMMGMGVGGSSALYGMIMERFFPSDFVPASKYPGTTESNLPDEWPISYGELLPYYDQAEALYRVHGTCDPMRPNGEEPTLATPPKLSNSNQALANHFEQKNLHPYHTPMACEYQQGCRECIGYICKRKCKVDSVVACLEPAVVEHGATLLDQCNVLSIESNQSRATAVRVSYRGEEFSIPGKTIVLAAGAIHSPALLLKSRSGAFPNGLANSSDMVGRNLMRHFFDYFLVKTNPVPVAGELSKQLALNDFYQVNGVGYGTLQSFGPLPPPRVLSAEMQVSNALDSKIKNALFGLMRPFIEIGAKSLFKDRQMLASIMEDLPYHENRVALKGNGALYMNYVMGSQDKVRLKKFRAMIKESLEPLPTKMLAQAHINQRIAHACGTCRFGDDPKNSVLDRNNRAHDLQNLYVVDNSFLPTSSGTNPSLTTAANALRVADTML